MTPVLPAIAERFAHHFAFGRNGLTLPQLDSFFRRFEAAVPIPQRWGNPTKTEYFLQCLNSLTPRNQRLALYDLCDAPPEMRQPVAAAERLALLELLVQADGASPLGVELSQVSLRGVREDWFTASSRLPTNPPAAITAARTLLESVSMTILAERNEVADTSGDLARLVKQVRIALGIDAAKGTGQGIHVMVSGLGNIVDGLSSMSNSAGDRHGKIGGATLDELTVASLAVHAAGTLALFLVQQHHERARQQRG